MSKNIIKLPLERQWFEMTKAGIKKEDYRELTSYWIARLTNEFSWDMNKYPLKINEHKQVINKGSLNPKNFQFNIMTLGYPSNSDTSRILTLEHKGIEIRTGNPEWGAEPDKLYFVIKHGEIINLEKPYINE